MRKVIFVGSTEGSSEESLARIDAAIAQIREAADALRAALAEDRLNEMQALEPLNLDSFASSYPGEFKDD